MGGGFSRISLNKLAFLPDKELISLFSASSFCCHGGRGREVDEFFVSDFGEDAAVLWMVVCSYATSDLVLFPLISVSLWWW